LLERIDASFGGFLLLAVLVRASPQLLIRILGAIVILIRLVCPAFREEREKWDPGGAKALTAKSRFLASLGMTKRKPKLQKAESE
jgi:hypothetical protein